MLPFTPEQFLNVFEQYNHGVWPAQLILYALGLLAIGLGLRPGKTSNRTVGGILSLLWLWSGVVYHWVYFSRLNKLAILFGALFVLQSVFLFLSGVIRRELTFHFKSDLKGVMGALLLAYALVVYPIIGHTLGHSFPRSPTFGVPCPITIFSFGILLWTSRRFSKAILLIPILWTLIGSSATVSLGMHEDFGLLIAGLITFVLVFRHDHRGSSSWWK